jgi:hypothetical protein
MTQYSNPDLTQREIIENSIVAIQAMLEQVDVSAAEAEAHRTNPVDYMTNQVIGQHISMLNGTKFQLQNELTRLNNIIAVWNGEEPTSTATPTMATQPLS